MDYTTDPKIIISMDATTLANKMKAREIRSVDATAVYIKHIQSMNKRINSVVAERFAEAMEQAKTCDEHINSSKQPHGRFMVFQFR